MNIGHDLERRQVIKARSATLGGKLMLVGEYRLEPGSG